MLVIMALVTTFMTGPLLTLIEWCRTREASQAERSEIENPKSKIGAAP